MENDYRNKPLKGTFFAHKNNIGCPEGSKADNGDREKDGLPRVCFGGVRRPRAETETNKKCNAPSQLVVCVRAFYFLKTLTVVYTLGSSLLRRRSFFGWDHFPRLPDTVDKTIIIEVSEIIR